MVNRAQMERPLIKKYIHKGQFEHTCHSSVNSADSVSKAWFLASLHKPLNCYAKQLRQAKALRK